MPYSQQQYDPAARTQQRLRQLEARITDPFGQQQARRARRNEHAYELQDEERTGLLKSIGKGTLGTLAAFGNIMDLPGSSIRDIASTLTGVPRNPFNQWLPHNWTTEEGRIRGRDLGRQWGWMKDKDTWGNLAGGIGLELAMDPLLPLGFGMGGASTKLGRAMDASGMMRFKKLALAKKNLAAKAAGEPQMGMREFMRKGRFEDLQAGVPQVLKKNVAKELSDAAHRFGYGSAHEMLKDTGREGFQAVARWGLPRMKMFGAKLTDKLKDSPGIMLGMPTSPWAQKYGQLWDKTLGFMGTATGTSYAARMIKAKLFPAAQQMATAHAQPIAEGYFAARQAGEELARQGATTSETVAHSVAEMFAGGGPGQTPTPLMDWMWQAFQDKPELFQSASRDWRGLAERIPAAWDKLRRDGHPEAVAAIDNMITDQLDRLHKLRTGAQEAGVNVTEMDDLFLAQYFPRQLSAFLDNLDKYDVAHPFKHLGSTSQDVHNKHLLSRHDLIKDQIGGTRGVDRVITDEENGRRAHQIIAAIRGAKNEKTKKKLFGHLAKYIQKHYGPDSPDPVYTWTGTGQKAVPGAAMRGRILTQSAGKTSKLAADDMDLAHLAVTSANWAAENAEKAGQSASQAIANTMDDLGYTVGSKFKKSRISVNDRIWVVEDQRYNEMARLMVNSSDEVLEKGMFANFPFYDLENYEIKMVDSILKANTVTDILSHPSSYAAAGQKGYKSLRDVLEELNMTVTPEARGAIEAGFDTVDPNITMQKIAAAMTGGKKTFKQVTDAEVQSLGNRIVTPETFNDLKQYFNMLNQDEASAWWKRVLDSFMVTFKGNVTSPFPAFHSRNLMSGQWRNMVAGQFSFRALGHSIRQAFGGDIPDLNKLPAIKQEYDRIKRIVPELGPLDNKLANRILGWKTGQFGTAGRHDLAEEVVTGAIQSQHPSTDVAKGLGKHPGGITYTRARSPGAVGHSPGHAARLFVGAGHKRNLRYWDPKQKKFVEETVRPPATTQLGILNRPFGIPTLGAPLWAAGKMVGKLGRDVLGSKSPRLARWADEPFFQMPSIMKQPGVFEGMGITGSKRMLGEGAAAGEPFKFFGPSQAGVEVGSAVEHVNRMTPMLKLLYDGHSFASAHAKATAAQISYRAKDYSKFEREVLKRIVPFYSFSSRTVPWALRQFIEHPGNLMTESIRGAKRVAEHKQEQIQHPGPVPPHIGDTLAIPLEPDVPGVKRFFTGLDSMDQDLWELGIPLIRALTGHGMRENLGDFLSQVGARTHPLYGKLPVEMMTGTSLWQRGAEGGRPLVSMDPPLARLLQSATEMSAKLSGQEVDPEHWERLGTPTMLDHLASGSPYTRYMSTARQLMDVRKGLGAKAVNMLTGAKITDVSLRAQEQILRDHLKSMIREAGGTIFEKATFSKDELTRMKARDPARYLQALQLKALGDERADIAKKMHELSKKGMPLHHALD